MEPIIVSTAVLGLLQQVLRLGRLGAAVATTHPIAIRRLTISTTSVDLVPVQPAGWPYDELASASRW